MYFPRTLLTGREPSETFGSLNSIVGGLSACIVDLVSTASDASSWSSASSTAGHRPPPRKRRGLPGHRLQVAAPLPLGGLGHDRQRPQLPVLSRLPGHLGPTGRPPPAHAALHPRG